jgi:hypothetical protein
VFEPFAPGAPTPPRLRREPARCQICGAFANRFCAVDAHNGRWVCVFCGASSFCRDYVGQDRAVRPSRCAWVSLRRCSPKRFPPPLPRRTQALPVRFLLPEEEEQAEALLRRWLDVVPPSASSGLPPGVAAFALPPQASADALMSLVDATVRNEC